MIRVILADDNATFLQAIKCLFVPPLDLVGTVNNGADLIEESQRLLPDVVVVDIAMPNMNGFNAVRALAHLKLPCKAVILTLQDEREFIDEALRCGAVGFVSKLSAGSDLARAIRAAARGKQFITSFLREPAVERGPHRPANTGSTKILPSSRRIGG